MNAPVTLRMVITGLDRRLQTFVERLSQHAVAGGLYAIGTLLDDIQMYPDSAEAYELLKARGDIAFTGTSFENVGTSVEPIFSAQSDSGAVRFGLSLPDDIRCGIFESGGSWTIDARGLISVAFYDPIPTGSGPVELPSQMNVGKLVITHSSVSIELVGATETIIVEAVPPNVRAVAAIDGKEGVGTQLVVSTLLDFGLCSADDYVVYQTETSSAFCSISKGVPLSHGEIIGHYGSYDAARIALCQAMKASEYPKCRDTDVDLSGMDCKPPIP